MNVSGASLEAGSLSGNSLQRCPKTRTPGWLARLLPCHSSVGSLTGSVTVPADLAKLAASPRPQKIPRSSFSPTTLRVRGSPVPSAEPAERSRPFLPGSPHLLPPVATPRSSAPSGKSVPVRRPRVNPTARLAASHFLTPTIQWSRTSPSYITSDPDCFYPLDSAALTFVACNFSAELQ